MTRKVFWLQVFWLLVCYAATVLSAFAEPQASLPFKRTVIKEVRFEWGFDGPAALMAAQIEQESAWRPGVCSPYACGLSQFTPDTEAWIKQLYSDRLGGEEGVFNPGWAIRALVVYDKHIYHKVPPAKTDCDRWSFTLSGYNGGPGWLNRDVRLCQRLAGCDGGRWLGNVAEHSKRASWALSENREYPRKIFAKQPNYASWGKQVQCSH